MRRTEFSEKPLNVIIHILRKKYNCISHKMAYKHLKSMIITKINKLVWIFSQKSVLKIYIFIKFAKMLVSCEIM